MIPFSGQFSFKFEAIVKKEYKISSKWYIITIHNLESKMIKSTEKLARLRFESTIPNTRAKCFNHLPVCAKIMMYEANEFSAREKSVFHVVKVSDFSRKPFCFRSVFSSLLLFFLFFFSFFLYHLVCSAITLSILNRFTSNFHNTMIVNRRFDSYTF